MSNARELAELGGAYATGGYPHFKNRIINGAMMIDQRNAGASVTPINTQYLVDRFTYLATQASKFTAQQNAGSVTPPIGFTNYLGLTVAATQTLGVSDFFGIAQRIEGFNISDLGWGTASASTVTLSFWVRSSLTGTFGGSLRNSAGNRSYVFSYTVNSANTWEQKSITISGDTSGTWLSNNGVGIDLFFGLGVGSGYSNTAGSWSSSNLLSATGATSVVGTNGATFYITGVQLEKGSTATSFDYRPYGTELALCQRYCLVWSNSANGPVRFFGWNNSSTVGVMALPIPVQLRTQPTGVTVTNASTMTYYASGTSYTISSVAFDYASQYSANVSVTTTGGMTTGAGNILALQASGNKIELTGMEL